MECYLERHNCTNSESLRYHSRFVEHQPNSSRPVQRTAKSDPSSPASSSQQPHLIVESKNTAQATPTVFTSKPHTEPTPPASASPEPLSHPMVVDIDAIELSRLAPKKGRRPGMVFIKKFDDFGVTHVEEISLSQEQVCNVAEPDRGALARLEGRLNKMSMSDGRNMDIDCGCTEVMGRWLPQCLGYKRGTNGG